MEAFNIQNIVQGNGVAISITGMAIVFSGLLIISVIIKLLPVLLSILDKKPEEAISSQNVEAPVAAAQSAEALSEAAVEDDDEKDIASLIGLILHLENERHYQSDNQYITINRDGTQQSMWGSAGRMRSTPHRRGYAKV